MTDTTIVAGNIQAPAARSAFAWSVVIAGALAAWAVAFIFISLGSGIGFAISSPYSGPSTATMTISGAIWLIFSETAAFSVGGIRPMRTWMRLNAIWTKSRPITAHCRRRPRW